MNRLKLALFLFSALLSSAGVVSGESCAGLNNGLVAYWSFDNCDVTDKSGHGYNGLVYGNPQCVSGVSGRAFNFDGVDDYMKVSVPLDGTADWTICSWVNITAMDSSYTDYQNIISNSMEGFQVGIDQAYYNDPAIWDDGWILFGAKDSISPGESGFLCYRKASQEITIYKNGAEIAHDDRGSSINFSQLTTIGMWKEDSSSMFDKEPLNGILDEIRVYNRALSQSEIQELFLNPQCVGACVLLPDGMVGWWPGDGNADDVIGGNNGTLINGATFAAGKVEQAFSFAGINDVIEIPDAASLDLQNAFTIDAWVRVDEPRDTANLVGRGDPVTTRGFNLFTDRTGNRYRCNIDDGPTDFDVFSTTPIAVGTFQHVACTFDGSTLRTYVDGVLEGSLTAPVMPDIDRPLLIGGSGRDSFKGLVDEVEIFNRALTSEEIQAIFAAGSAGKCKAENNSPAANAGPDQTVEMTSCEGARVMLDGSGSSDPDNDSLTYTWTENETVIANGVNQTVTLSYGTHTITLTVDDGKGGTASDDVVVKVVDTTPPALTVTLNPNILWPPNHKYVKVTPSITVTDACRENVTVRLLSSSSSEPDNGLGDGDTANDIMTNADGTISLRAERSGKGRGRVYTIIYQATDIGGNTATAQALVTAPHNK